MKNDPALTVLSLLAIVLFSMHITDDIIRGYEPPTSKHFQGMAIFTTYLFVTLGLGNGRWRNALLLLGGLFASLVPLAHFSGKGLGPKLVASDGALLYISGIYFLGVIGPTAALLAAKALWNSRKKEVILLSNQCRGEVG